MRTKLSFLLAILLITGCSTDDSHNRNIEKNYVGNKYAHLFYNTPEECESAREMYFTNCAQILEILNDSEVGIMVTDILYTTSFHIENDKLIVESSSNTYEFSEDLIFQILENGDLKLNGRDWIKYEGSYYE